MVSGPEVGDNLAQAAALLEEAAAAGARLAVLPENFALLGSDEHDKLDIAETDGNGPVQAFLAEQARRHGIWLVGGSVPLRSEEAERVYSACLVYDSARSEEHTSELQSREKLVCRLLLEKKKANRAMCFWTSSIPMRRSA